MINNVDYQTMGMVYTKKATTTRSKDTEMYVFNFKHIIFN